MTAILTTATRFIPPRLGFSAWLDASQASTLTLSGSDVVEWRDVTINGYDFTVPSNAPTYNATGFNGKPTIAFASASSQSLSAGDKLVSGGNGHSVAVVGRHGAAGNQMFWSKTNGGSNGVAYGMAINGITLRYVGINSLNVVGVADNAITANTDNIMIFRFDNSVLEFWLNGALMGVTDALTGPLKTFSAPLMLGGFGAAGSNLNGMISEVVFYFQPLTDDGITTLTKYFQDKWLT